MTVPISAFNRLERKKESVRRRVEELRKALTEAEAELRVIEAASSALSQGGKVNLQEILGEVRLSQKDYVLEAVKKRPSRGMTRADIVEHLNSKRSLDIS